MRTVYLGTSEFAVTVLERLAASAHRPSLVVTRPDKPRGRGRRLSPPPVATAAAALGIPVVQPAVLGDAQGEIAAAEPEALCVCAYGAIVKEPLLSAHPMLNVHPSLLPRWRGAAPVERAIMAGDAETGVCIIRLVAALDAGPVGVRGVEAIRPDDTFGTLAPRLAALGGDLLVHALDTPPTWVEQEEDGLSYAEKIESADRRLDPEAEDAIALDRRVRSLTPHIGGFLELPGEIRLGVSAVRILGADEGTPAPGLLVARDGRPILGCATGALELVEVQPPGKRPMAAADWLRGHPLESS